jgi:hypothetical protein
MTQDKERRLAFVHKVKNVEVHEIRGIS